VPVRRSASLFSSRTSRSRGAESSEGPYRGCAAHASNVFERSTTAGSYRAHRTFSARLPAGRFTRLPAGNQTVNGQTTSKWERHLCRTCHLGPVCPLPPLFDVRERTDRHCASIAPNVVSVSRCVHCADRSGASNVARKAPFIEVPAAHQCELLDLAQPHHCCPKPDTVRDCLCSLAEHATSASTRRCCL
jgi:hypothetical protein